MSGTGSTMSAALPAVGAPARRRPLTESTALQRALRNPRVVVPAVFLVLIGLVALAAPPVAPHDPTAQDANPLMQPSGTYLLGTDDFGRDVLSRLIYGGRVSLGVSVASVLVATCIGVWLGLFAGYYRGWIETVIMRAMD